MITIRLNGERRALEKICSLSEALSAWGYPEQGFAVALNQKFVPKSEHATLQIAADDEIEVVMPMQGG